VYQEKLEEMMAFLDAKEYITVKSLSDFPEFEGKPEEDYQEILRVTYGSREFEARMADPLTIKATLKESNKGDQTLLNSFLGLKSFMLQDQFHELDKLGLSKKELEEAGIGLVAGMMIMGKALTPLLAKYFPSDEYFRFSIHAHPFEGKKFTILLLPVRVKKQTIKKLNTSSLGVCTPWHTAACFEAADGSMQYLPSAELKKGYDIEVQLDQETRETFKEIFDLWDDDNNEALDVSEIKSAVLGGQKVAPSRGSFIQKLGHSNRRIKMQGAKTPSGIKLDTSHIDAVSVAGQRVHRCNLVDGFIEEKVKEVLGDEPLVSEEDPWLMLRLTIDRWDEERKHRLESIKATMLRPDFGI
jgi:hypothetical protein